MCMYMGIQTPTYKWNVKKKTLNIFKAFKI